MQAGFSLQSELRVLFRGWLFVTSSLPVVTPIVARV